MATAPQTEEEPETPEDGENAVDTEDTENAEDAGNPQDDKSAEEENEGDGENAEDGENPEGGENVTDMENEEEAENPGDGESTEGETAKDAENPEDGEDGENTDGAENPAEGESAAPERHVRVSLSWEKSGDQPAFGDRAILSAQLEGYESAAYTLQWQTSRDGTAWTDVPGVTMPSLILTMTENNYRDYWRVLVTAEAPAAGKNEASGGADAPEAGE